MKKLIKKYKKEFSIVVVLACIVSALNVVGAYLLSELLNSAIQASVSNLVKSTILIIVIWSAMYYLQKVRNNYSSLFRAKINTQIRNNESISIEQLSNDEWEKTAPSEMLAKYTSNIDMIDRNCIDPILEISYYFFTLIFSFIAICTIHWSVVVLSIVMYIVMTKAPGLFQNKLEKVTKKNAEENENLTRVVNDCLYGRQEYIIYNNITRFFERLNLASESSENARYGFDRTSNLMETVVGIIGFLFQCALIFLVAWLSIKGYTKAGAILAVGNLAGTFSQSVTVTVANYSKIKSNISLLDFNLEKEEIECIDKILPIEISNLKEINRGDNKVLYDGKSFQFEKGGKYLIVGESGSGKSKIIKSLFHNNFEYEGEITVNHQNRNCLDYRQFNDGIAYIEQDSHIFNDTLRNNLTMGKNVDDSMLLDMIKELNLGDFFDRCNKNLDYLIDDQGANISGGEKQRICLGRALLSGKSILVMDESFSAMDQNNIQSILTMLLNRKDITVIMTAHNINNTMYPLFSKVYHL